MSPPGRPKGESLSAQREGSPVSRAARPQADPMPGTARDPDRTLIEISNHGR
jgi:hypothetical protein